MNSRAVLHVVEQPIWDRVALYEVAQVVNGGTPQSKVTKYWGEGIQWLTPKDMGQMGGREIAETPRTISKDGLANSSARLVPENSVIVSTRAPIGHLAINKVPMAFNQGCRGIVPKACLDHVYLYYFLKANRQLLDDLGVGATFKELSATNLKAVRIPLPSLEEQKRIVAVLDQAFAALDRARAHAEANLADAGSLLAEMRERLLDSSRDGWRSLQLSELISIKHGFAFKSEFFSGEGEHVLLTPGNFFEEGGFRDREAKQKYYVGEVPAGFVLKEGDLLMAMTEQAPGLLGSCILVPEGGRFLHNQRLGLIQPRDGVAWCSPYFAQVFNLRKFRKELSDTCTGIKVRHTSPDRIRSVSIPVPPSIEMQRSIANELDELTEWTRSLKVSFQEKLADLAALRQSLLQKAFSGQL